jgi:DNA-binding transcriptional regulator YhcF (GntR family)
MLIRLDPQSTDPLYRQIGAQVRAAVAKGKLVVGDRLPPARELADALGVNMHTVLRAYAELRDAGLVEMRRRRGVVVVGGGDGRARLLTLAADLTREARRQGLGRRELVRMIDEAL